MELPRGPLSSRWAPCGLGAGLGCWGKDRPGLGQTADEVAWGGVPRAGLSTAAWSGRGHTSSGQDRQQKVQHLSDGVWAPVRRAVGAVRPVWVGPSPRPPHLCWGPPPHST